MTRIDSQDVIGARYISESLAPLSALVVDALGRLANGASHRAISRRAFIAATSLASPFSCHRDYRDGFYACGQYRAQLLAVSAMPQFLPLDLALQEVLHAELSPLSSEKAGLLKPATKPAQCSGRPVGVRLSRSVCPPARP